MSCSRETGWGWFCRTRPLRMKTAGPNMPFWFIGRFEQQRIFLRPEFAERLAGGI